MDIEQEGFPNFQIMIDQNQMVSSYNVNPQKNVIVFPKANLQVNEQGISLHSDNNVKFNKIKIQTKNIQIMEELGRGISGVVHRAIYDVYGKTYVFAVKSINAIQKQDRKHLLNDLRQNLFGGNSQYLTQFFTCYFQDGLVKQVIQYMDMGDLRRIIKYISEKKLSLTEKELATITYSILKGLEYIHHVRHSIHRDIKPENILFNSKGQIKICDFGVSKNVDKSMGKSTCGTVTYMSPQRFSMVQHSTYTYKTDIWSLGIILYELATGLPNPYASKNQMVNYFKIASQIQQNSPPSLPSDKFSQKMCDFVSRCLIKEENQRYSSQILLKHPWIVENRLQSLNSLVQKMYYL